MMAGLSRSRLLPTFHIMCQNPDMRFVVALLLLPAVSSAAGVVDFATTIQPILEAKCYACHGGQQQMGQLRLDSRAVVMARGPSGPRIVAHRPEASSVYRRVAGLGSGNRMPMGGQLSDEEIAAIRSWIEHGADWPEGAGTQSGLDQHWAFVAPLRPQPPENGSGWGVNPIDSFVLARLESEGLQPSPPASGETLVRRLSLDLTGLPPTVTESERFLGETGPRAYDRLVERLLASPHFGERWGRIWLDAARYADSDGFEKDKPRNVWFYRDWVVTALNADIPYDRFIIEQIAGDLLPGATQANRVATGFLRNSMINAEGGANPEQFRMEAMFDRMDAIGKAILGLTVQCAQCHDHKYDPITQQDYYRLFAFINNSHESSELVYTAAENQRRAEILGEIRAIEQELKHRTPTWREHMAAWEQAEAHGQPEWTVLAADIKLGSGEKYTVLPDRSILADGYAPTRSMVSPEGRLEPGTVRAFRLELLTDPRLPLGGPGRSFRGTAALTEFTVEYARESRPEAWQKIELSKATADVNPPVSWLDPFLFPDKDNRRRVLGDIGFAVDGFEMSAWLVDGGPGRRNMPRKAVFQLEKPLVADEPLLLRFNLSMQHGGWNSDDNQSLNLGRYRFSVTSHAGAVADPLPAAVRSIVSSVPPDRRSLDQEATVFGYWRTTVPEWAEANHRIEELWKGHPEGSSQLVLHERNEPRMTSVLQRGDFLRPTEQVEPGVPAFLHPMPERGDKPDRLAFAEWLAGRNSPTTARAVVNRIWQAYFGTGIVETSEDLGRQAAEPSHPELLDWLAVELMENDWSLKHIHRLVVSSDTYRQASRVTPALIERDPNNRLLARGSRFRVDGELVRDIALSSSGLLTTALGGPPVYPPAPEFLFLPPTSYGPKRWYVAENGERYRRSLYGFRYRSVPYPVLSTFDTPTGDFACVKRVRSNTPLQALVTLNETTFVEAARELGRQALVAGGASDAERIEYAFKRVLARAPADAEREELLAFLDGQRERIDAGQVDPVSLVRGRAPFPVLTGEAPDTELAAWTALSRVLLNLDEAITRE